MNNFIDMVCFMFILRRGYVGVFNILCVCLAVTGVHFAYETVVKGN